MPPLVTVLTAVRNGSRFLPETISSIQRQTLDDWEYVVVDDASTDETPRIVEAVAEKDPRVKLIVRREQGGPYAAANEGLTHAAGRYIARIDADDVALPTRLERQISFLRDTGLRGCAAFFRRHDEVGRLMPDTPQTEGGVRSMKYRLCLRQGLVHSTALVERDALLEIGGYRELPASQDLRLWCDLARRDWLGVIPEVLVYLRRPGSLTSSSTELQEELAIEILKEHLDALDPEGWTQDEICALRPGWFGLSVDVRMAALRRWIDMWQADPDLGSGERRELTSLGRRVRWDITRGALRREGVSMSTLRGLISMRRRTVRTQA